MSDLGSVGNTASGRVDAYNTDWQAASQTPSTSLRHPSFGGRCWKVMLGVWQRQSQPSPVWIPSTGQYDILWSHRDSNSKRWFTTSGVGASLTRTSSTGLRHLSEPTRLELQALVYDILWCYIGYILHTWLNRTLTFHGIATQVIYYIHDWLVHWPSMGLLHRLYTTYMTDSYTDLPRDCYTGYILHKYMTESYTDLPRDCYTGYILHTWLNRTLTFPGER